MDFALARKRLGYTQTQIAEMIGVKQSAVSLWEKGVSHPNIKVLPKAAEVYGVDASELIAPRKRGGKCKR